MWKWRGGGRSGLDRNPGFPEDIELMSWKRFAATFSTAVVLGAAGPAFAADQEFGRSGPSVGVGAIYAFEIFDDDSTVQGADNGFGYDLKGGYRFNEYFALELRFEHLPDMNDVEIWQLDVSGKFYPFHGMVQPYLLTGVGLHNVEDDRAGVGTGGLGVDGMGVGLRFGIGVDFYITRNWAIYVEGDYLLPTGGRSDYDAIPVGLGVLYRFY
jgi:opacity protein-like surface antigen